MNKTRRDFIKQGGLAAAAIAATGAFSPSPSFAGLIGTKPVEMPQDDVIRGLMMTALNTAKAAGASYSDVRIGRYRQSFVFTREQQIVHTVDTDSLGAGVRALVNGTWGFGATQALTTDGVAAAAREAVAIAKANRIASDKAVQLAQSRRIRTQRGRAPSRSIPSRFRSSNARIFSSRRTPRRSR